MMDRKKYIVEASDDVKKVIAMGVTCGGAIWTDTTDIENLEEFNSDYINKHFSKLLQDAHDTGYKEGCAKKVEVMFDGEYQRGFEDGRAISDKGCDGCEYSDGVVQENFPCANCCNYYTNNWTKKEFVRGDVVVDERDGTRGIVVSSENNESNLLYVLFKGYRVPQSVVRKYYKKTGEHFDIDKILEVAYT